MRTSTETAFRHFLARWSGGACRRGRLVGVAVLLVTLAVAAFDVSALRINTDTEDMLSRDLPFQRDSETMSEAFPQFSDTLVVMIDAASPDLADDAALALRARMEEEAGVFGPVFDPATHPFFRRHGLLYLDTAELADLSDRLAEAQPFLGVLWQDRSLAAFLEMLDDALTETIDTQGDMAFDVAPVLEHVAGVVEAQAAGRFGELSWQELMSGETEEGPFRRTLLLQPPVDFGKLNPGEAAMGAVRSTARDLGLTPDNGVEVRLTGSIALSQEELASVERGMGIAGLVSMALVSLVLGFGLRSVRLVLCLLATLIVGLIWTAGFALATVGEFNLISVAFAVLFIGLSVDFGVHFTLRYREGLTAGHDNIAAVEHAAAGAGGALTLCAATTAIAFFSFLPTDYNGLAELGFIAGAGMIIAWFANLTVLPALLSLLPLPEGRVKPLPTVMLAGLHHVAARGRVPLAVVVVAAVGGSAVLLPQVRFDFDPMSLRDPSTESVRAAKDLLAEPDTNPYGIEVLAADLDAAQALGQRLEALPEVSETGTLADLVPEDQTDKLAIVDDMAFFLAPSLAGGGTARDTTREEAAQRLAAVRAKLNTVTGAGMGRLSEAAARLAGAFEALFGPEAAEPDPAAMTELEGRLLARLPGRVETLRAGLDAGRITLDTLPEAVRERMVTDDGRARLTVSPAGDMMDRSQLRAFVEAVRAVEPRATGDAVVILEAGNTVVNAFVQATLIALAAIAALVSVLWRRALDTAFVFVPLGVAAVLTAAATVLLGMPFNFANVIVLPLLFGIGIDFTIHILVRAREAGSAEAFRTSTPRAIIVSALTTIGSFGSIALSSHPGTASMGVLLTVAVLLSLVSVLAVLPVLMAFRDVAAAGGRGR